jgi:hypothetical protein
VVEGIEEDDDFSDDGPYIDSSWSEAEPEDHKENN